MKTKLTSQVFLFVAIAFAFSACKKDTVELDMNNLNDYVEFNNKLVLDDLISCAGGNNTEFMGDTQNPISVFFYPDAGATDFRYFETTDVSVDKSNYANYTQVDLGLTPLFNGTMMKFDHPAITTERWGVVTYRTEGKLHICNPVRLKPSSAPTSDISSITTVTENGTTPAFDWTPENEPSNVIYFSIVADNANNLISGVYTYDKFWTFYDLSNVVLNVSPPNPSLTSGDSYNYTLMGVSEDNWVHTMAMQSFVATP